MASTVRNPVGNRFIVAASVVVIVAGMRVAAPILVPFLFAVFLAIILSPAVQALTRWGCNEVIALIVVVAIVVLIGLGLVGIVGQSVGTFSRNSDAYQERLDERLDLLRKGLADQGIEVSEDINIASMDSKQLLQFAAYALSNLNSLFKNGLLICLTTLLLLLEGRSVRDKFEMLDSEENDIVKRIELMSENTRRYLMIKTVISVATGVCVWIGLKLLDVPFAELWALVSFLLNYVPTIGSLLAAVPAVFLALIENGVANAIWTTVLFVAVNQILGTFVEPRIQGRGLGLSPFVVFVSLIFWGWVLGPVGMVLSAPLTMVVKIACEADPKTEWVSVMLGQGNRRHAKEARS